MQDRASLSPSSDWVVRLLGKKACRFFSTLNPGDLLEKGTIHASFLRVHHSAELVLSSRLHFRACEDSDRHCIGILHLIEQKLLVFKEFCLALFISFTAVLCFLICSLHPSIHIGLVGAGVLLLTQALLSYLVLEDLVEGVVFCARLVLVVDVLEACLLILLETLLDVLAFLFHLKLLPVVLDHVRHVVHHGLNAITAFLHLLFASPLFLQG